MKKYKEENVTPKFTDNHGYDEINSSGIIFFVPKFVYSKYLQNTNSVLPVHLRLKCEHILMP